MSDRFSIWFADENNEELLLLLLWLLLLLVLPVVKLERASGRAGSEGRLTLETKSETWACSEANIGGDD